MKKLLMYFVMMFVLLGIMPSPKQAAEPVPNTVEPQVNVKLVNYLGNQTSITLKITGSYYLNGTSNLLISNKTYTLKVENQKLGLYDGNTKLVSGSVNVSITPINKNNRVMINNRDYQGSFNFTVEKNLYVRPVNTINMEDYLKSVVPSEMYASWSKEALKTQAVAARTVAYFRLNKSLDDTTFNQAYGGAGSLYANSNAAVDETAGEIITYNGTAIDAMFSASNGGMTENNFNETGKTLLPYYPIQKDDYDTQYKWSTAIHKQQINTTELDLSHPNTWWNKTTEIDQTLSNNLKAWLAKNGYSNKEIKIISIPKLAFYEPTDSGRVSRGDISFTFLVKDQVDSTGKLVLNTMDITHLIADTVRSFIGFTQMRSNLISNSAETTDVYTISGTGYGHGVGMSQYGAQNRALAGIAYKDILSFYYPGTVVSKIYQPLEKNNLKTGWIKQGVNSYYLDSTGKATVGWLNVGGKKYYFDNNGVMKTGWIKLGTIWYYLDSTGVMKTGWVKSGTTRYYLDSTGAMKTGW
ncbi:MAG: SpoIID/LytB domain-containing protein, partial [Neobacillus sp.]